MKKEIYFCMVTGFGRSISEVGAVMLVGGNIKGRTRTMTTTISLLKSQGIFTEGVALGVLLLVMAFLLQWICDILQKEEAEDENTNLEKTIGNFHLEVDEFIYRAGERSTGSWVLNGCGKTVFLKMVAKILKPDGGSIDYEGLTGRDITMMSRRPI